MRFKSLFFHYINFFRSLPYYTSARLLVADFFIFTLYFLRSPYQVLKGQSDFNPYGETPYSTLDKIAKECQILSGDLVYDLGCGRGKTLFWLESHVGCRGVGVDNQPRFIRWAKRSASLFGFSRVQFIQEDFSKVDLRKASVIYLYGTAFPDEVIEALIENFKRASSEVKIITVTYPLSDFSPHFKTTHQFEGKFSWGKTPIYISEARNCTKGTILPSTLAASRQSRY